MSLGWSVGEETGRDRRRGPRPGIGACAQAGGASAWDWARLLQDLVDWRRHSGRVTCRWLQDFYRR
ncbi:type I-E CRISPR-associated protein Cse2/CasB [Streptomyces sp. NPDC087437]|uniref:type I-E CRISPR-associated protein Cse2/CasB n=1 Tax=Streptomyces sp. NPDC087437 TaxID=3365789 RepID=UPI003829CE0E